MAVIVGLCDSEVILKHYLIRRGNYVHVRFNVKYLSAVQICQ